MVVQRSNHGPLCHPKTTVRSSDFSTAVLKFACRHQCWTWTLYFHVFSTVGHIARRCLSIGTSFMTFTKSEYGLFDQHWFETAFAGRFCQADTLVGIFSVLAPQGLWLILWQLRVQWWWLISLQVLPAALFSLSNERLNREVTKFATDLHLQNPKKKRFVWKCVRLTALLQVEPLACTKFHF